MNRFQERAEALGPLGLDLLAIIQINAKWIANRYRGSTTQCGIEFEGSLPGYNRIHPLLGPAVSCIALPFPLHVRGDNDAVWKLVHLALPLGPAAPLAPSSHPTLSPFVRRSKNINSELQYVGTLAGVSRDFRRACHPIKSAPAADVKANLRTGGLCRAFSRLYSENSLGRLFALTAGTVSDDQFQMIMIYGHSLYSHLGWNGFRFAHAMVTNPERAKGLSTVLKALGWNATQLGSYFTEGTTLLGKGVGAVDWEKEIGYRTDPELVRPKLVIAHDDEIRMHVRAIIDMELDGDCNLPTVADFWSSRWAWCVNGSQTAKSNELLDIDLASYGTHDRFYRRMAAEAVSAAPFEDWDGTTFVSPSSKVEAGKTRAIFACDTRSYFGFSYILNQVQKDWKNKRVLLDPGKGGTLGISRRIRGAMSRPGINLMLDYDDFNSQHSTRSMQIVFEEICSKYNAPPEYTAQLVSSFEKTYIMDNQTGEARQVAGTLMSGHRGTTFVNSVLNAAYLRMGAGASWFDHGISLHTGDDVYVRASSLKECGDILDGVKRVGCRVNPTKQSIGYFNAEFLRCAYNQGDATGYICRSISSLVNGNWTNDKSLGPLEALTTLIVSCRAVKNRGRTNSIGPLISSAVRFNSNCSPRVLGDILDGFISLEGQPCFNRDQFVRTVRVRNDGGLSPPPSDKWPLMATRAYLNTHVSSVESRALELAKVDPTPLMAASSYSKGQVVKDEGVRSPLVLVQGRAERSESIAVAEHIFTNKVEGGALSAYPMIMLIRNRLSTRDIRELLGSLGVPTSFGHEREIAFGEVAMSRNFLSALPLSDAASLQARTSAGNIVALSPIYM